MFPYFSPLSAEHGERYMHHFKMTRLIIFLTFAFTLTFCTNNSRSTIIPTDYKIEIKQWGILLGGDSYWIITQDSLKIKKENIGSPTDTFSRAISPADKQAIIDALTKVELKTIQKEYVNNSAPDDMGEFDFKISIDGQTSEFHIYQVKLDNVFKLVKQINELLPDNYQIGYNDEYFRFKK